MTKTRHYSIENKYRFSAFIGLCILFSVVLTSSIDTRKITGIESTEIIEETILEQIGKDISIEDIDVDEQLATLEEEMLCNDKEFLKGSKVTFDYERGMVYFQFPSIPSKEGAKALQFLVVPKELDWWRKDVIDSGFHLHNEQRIKLSTDKKIQAVPMALSVSSWWGNHHEVKNKTRGDSRLVDTELVLYSRSSHGSARCIIHSGSVDLLEFEGISRIAPYFAENIIEPYALIEVNISNFDQELEYIKSKNELVQLRKQNTLLPKPNEEALALLLRDYNYDEDFIGTHTHRWETSRTAEWRTRYSTDKDAGIVFGLFGKAEPSDLETISTIIKALHVVAPTLNASYSTDPDKVTLPIHFTTCTDEASESGMYCRGGAAGFFLNGDYGVHNHPHERIWDIGWIWIDASLEGSYREYVLYHEIGHSLGLPHNACYSSTMSYERGFGGWTALDLMMLNVMYNPNKEPMGKYFHPVPNKLIDAGHLYEWHEQKIIYYNLSEEKFESIKDEPWDSCSKREKGWESLLSLIHGG